MSKSVIHSTVRFALAVLFCSAVVLCSAQKYTHRKVGSFVYIHNLTLNERGDYAMTATMDDSDDPHAKYRLYVNGTDYSSPLFSVEHRAKTARYGRDGNLYWIPTVYTEPVFYRHLFVGATDYTAEHFPGHRRSEDYAVNSSGLVSLSLLKNPEDVNSGHDVYLGQNNVSGAVLGTYPNRDALPRYVTDDGHLFWKAHVADGAPWDLYRDQQNLSSSLLGSNRGTNYVFANTRGDYLWEGWGANTNRVRNVFLGQNNLTLSVLGTVNSGSNPLDINESVHVIWYSGRNIYRNSENMSDFLGPDHFASDKAFVSESGDALWAGRWADTPNSQFAFLNRQLLSGVLGSDQLASVLGFDGLGQPLWYGSGSSHPKQDLFVGDFNLSADALGEGRFSFDSQNIATNSKGQVLWVHYLPYGPYGRMDAWLSSPVPEPSVWIALTAVVLLSRKLKCS